MSFGVLWVWSHSNNVRSTAVFGPGFTLKDLESVPFGVALPIREAIYRCREQPCSDWSEEVCLLIGRQDLTKQAHKMTLAKDKAVSAIWVNTRSLMLKNVCHRFRELETESTCLEQQILMLTTACCFDCKYVQ